MKKKRDESSVRIIAGKWRGRKITFSAIDGLRPTHDRIRETLFNWLQFDVVGARCLDLFAGSGALGFEALSRGAKHAIFVDQANSVFLDLMANREALNASNSDVLCLDFINKAPQSISNHPFDIIFLDPPFNKDYLPLAIERLNEHGLVKCGSLVYIECEVGAFNAMKRPQNWECIKHKKTKSLEYGLLRVVL